jgi:membrane associated rhomboid family serine protease
VAEAPVTAGLIALQVAVLALVAWRLGDPTRTSVLVQAGALEPGRVRAGEWWRLLSAVFLHVGWFHLLLNSAFGFSWCRSVERALGHGRFLAIYLAAGLGGSAASLLIGDLVSAGASGALFGMIGATLALHRRVLDGWFPFLKSPATVSVAVQLALWTTVAVVQHLPIDHAAHAGGLVTGALAAWIATRPEPGRWTAWAPLAAGLAVAVAAGAWPRPGPSRYGELELERAVYEALRREDVPAAEAALARAEAAGARSQTLELYRAYLDVQRGRLEDALGTLPRPLRLRRGVPPGRRPARPRGRGGRARRAARHRSGSQPRSGQGPGPLRGGLHRGPRGGLRRRPPAARRGSGPGGGAPPAPHAPIALSTSRLGRRPSNS